MSGHTVEMPHGGAPGVVGLMANTDGSLSFCSIVSGELQRNDLDFEFGKTDLNTKDGVQISRQRIAHGIE
jgi:hypothetical protein